MTETKKREHPICNTVGCDVVANWVHEGGIGASCDYCKNEWYTIRIDDADVRDSIDFVNSLKEA